MGKLGPWLLHLLLHVVLSNLICAFPIYPRPKRDLEINPEENIGVNGYLVEGDILRSRRRNAVRDYYQTWINRTVPFVMGHLSPEEEDMVRMAMESIMAQSCVRFVRRTKEIDYINIIKSEGCSSSVGRRGGPQPVILGNGCYVNGIILHELMHALGFWHEHSRPDRDVYINIMWNNIAEEHKTNFERYTTSYINTLDTQYDYGSIMHYKNNTFAIDRSRVTISATSPLPPGVEMGQRIKLSDTDVIKLKRLYKCNITHCSDPGVPENGVRFGHSLQVGTTVTYSCNRYYHLFGSRGRFCLDIGEWVGHLPSCLPDPHGEVHSCNYDGQHLCGWMRNTSFESTWTLNTRSTPSNGTGPMEDHTMGTEEGWYIYLESSSTKAGDRARIISPPLRFNTTGYHGQQGMVCMMFYYFMHGRDMGTLNVYQRSVDPSPDTSTETSPETLVFSRSGEQGNMWKQAIFTLPLNTAYFSVVLEAVAGHGYLSDIALDDMVIAPCTSLMHLESYDVAETLECSFDHGLCELEQDEHDDFDWTFDVDQTPTYNTGPKCDPVNCGTGSYLYTEASRPRDENDTARILTPLLHGDGSRCLLFFWHMKGDGMGQLSVKLVRPLEGVEPQRLWSRAGHQGNDWNYERLDIVHTPRFYKLAFEGSIGHTYRSDMAIDNIELVVGECREVVRNNCDFNRDTCSWQNIGQRSWQRHYGSTPTPETGPEYDHNNNTMERYVYVESSRTQPNQTARLRSGKILGEPHGHCLQFWYHMYGEDVGTLRLLMATLSTPRETELWRRQGSLGSTWRKQDIYVRSPGENFKVIFEARLTGGGKGDIALDDISVNAGQCDSELEVE